MSDNFIAGDEARLTNMVTDIAGALVDPGTLTLTVKLPSGDLSLPAVTRASVGNYYADLPLATSGIYLYRWSSPSPYMSAAEGELFVEQSAL